MVAAAIDHAKSDLIDVALLDDALADQNSERLQAVLERRDIPFVVLTGYPRVLVGRDDSQKVLSKPISDDLLYMTIKSAGRPAER